MKFIIEITKTLFFTKKEKAETNLSKEQKKKYSKQFLKNISTSLLIFLPLIYGIGDTIILFLTTGKLLYIAHAVVFGFTLEKVAKQSKVELLLIEERIKKREKKNKKQLKNGKSTN